MLHQFSESGQIHRFVGSYPRWSLWSLKCLAKKVNLDLVNLYQTGPKGERAPDPLADRHLYLGREGRGECLEAWVILLHIPSARPSPSLSRFARISGENL